MRTIMKILTIISGALIALILTRMGISYLLILIALGIIMPFLTQDKKSAIISGALYALISYIISYPSGLFLKNYMPSIEIPVNVTFIEVVSNLLIGALVPIIIAIILCAISSIMGEYLSDLIRNKNKKQDEKYSFNSTNKFNEDKEETYEKFSPKTKRKLEELSPIQKAKNRRKNEE